MVSVCLPSDALLQHLPSYLGFSYLGCGVSLHGCSSKVQPLLLTLDEGYLLTAAPPDLERGIAPLDPPAPVQPLLLGRGVAPPGRRPGLGRGVAPLGCSYTVTAWHSRPNRYSYTAAPAAKLLQSCLILCDPIDGSPLGSSVPGIL